MLHCGAEVCAHRRDGWLSSIPCLHSLVLPQLSPATAFGALLCNQSRKVRRPPVVLSVHARAALQRLSSTSPALCLQHLPQLPENAQFFPVDPAACHFGLGTFGLVLKSEKISDDSFKHFIFASSRARGPFMAPYLQVSCSQVPLHLPAWL